MTQISSKTRRQMIALIFTMVAVTVVSAFSIVWMQQQIARSAESSQTFESQLAETLRKLRFVDERIATQHQPIVLQGKVTGVLRPSLENQVVWVDERQLPSGRSYAVSQPYEVSTDLALLDTNIGQ